MKQDFGFDIIEHRGKRIPTTVGNSSYEDKFLDIDKNFTYRIGTIPPGYESRPDLISYIFYGTSDYWWLLMEVNNVTNIFEGFNIGDSIIIPNL